MCKFPEGVGWHGTEDFSGAYLIQDISSRHGSTQPVLSAFLGYNFVYLRRLVLLLLDYRRGSTLDHFRQFLYEHRRERIAQGIFVYIVILLGRFQVPSATGE